jgi:peptide/nickel transport system ATP-binding protein
MSKLLEVQDLVLRFYTYAGVVKALEGVNLYLKKKETLGIVGETGSGKTMTGLSILSLVPTPGKIEGGKVIFQDGDDSLELLSQKDAVLRNIRGKNISIIFQEPGSSLNPVYTVGDQIAEVILLHRKREMCERALAQIEKEELEEKERKRKKIEKEIKDEETRKRELEELERQKRENWKRRMEKKVYRTMLKNPNSISLKFFRRIPIIGRYRRLKRETRKEVVNILHELEIADPGRVVDMYPHELSGGMQQRVVIGIALACNPIVLIADEPTTSLDMTVQAQIMDLIRKLKEKFGSSILYITHDMGVVAELCDRVAVMYAGSVCETAEVKELFKNPLHPYTKALLESIPRPGQPFKSISGMVPGLIDPPSGCRFHPRCSFAKVECAEAMPKMNEIEKEHFVACYLY